MNNSLSSLINALSSILVVHTVIPPTFSSPSLIFSDFTGLSNSTYSISALETHLVASYQYELYGNHQLQCCSFVTFQGHKSLTLVYHYTGQKPTITMVLSQTSSTFLMSVSNIKYVAELIFYGLNPIYEHLCIMFLSKLTKKSQKPSTLQTLNFIFASVNMTLYSHL